MQVMDNFGPTSILFVVVVSWVYTQCKNLSNYRQKNQWRPNKLNKIKKIKKPKTLKEQNDDRFLSFLNECAYCMGHFG